MLPLTYPDQNNYNATPPKFFLISLREYMQITKKEFLTRTPTREIYELTSELGISVDYLNS